MNERYRGGHDIILDLPAEYDINHIDWLSVYCYKFRVDFGHVPVTNISQRIPPYVPPQKRFDEAEFSKIDGWPLISLLGTEDRLNFTFQLGPPGGRKGYEVSFCVLINQEKASKIKYLDVCTCVCTCFYLNI
ncbi:unnamed protein product [Gongylonema pulchrum]|uniref:DM13 domain-containing protein n=1 Tax=Gongylonema pulchrum TaxID=637853 RepID=A0A183D5L5_9BILA|nr:unnamed protein product [Gongylonema pulchrum]